MVNLGKKREKSEKKGRCYLLAGSCVSFSLVSIKSDSSESNVVLPRRGRKPCRS